MTEALIGAVRDLWGGLGNMSPHPIFWMGGPWDRKLTFPRAEQLFQAMRFPAEHPILHDLLRITNPMAAKMRAKALRSEMLVDPCSTADLENMRQVLRAKHQQHGEIRALLEATLGMEVIEDCSRRPHGSGLFWGARRLEGVWVGENWLGKLWMEIRDRS